MHHLPPLFLSPSTDLLSSHSHLYSLAQQLSQHYHAHRVTEAALKTIGAALWQVLDVDASLPPQALMIECHDNAIESLPWECLYHPELGFLGKHPDYTLSRRVRGNTAQPPKGPLKILLFTAQPEKTSYQRARLDIEIEQQQVYSALVPFISAGWVRFYAPDDGRFSTFVELLHKKPWHLVILSGHGFVPKTTDALTQSDSLGEQKTTDALTQSDSLGEHSTSLGEHSITTTDILAQSDSLGEHSITTTGAITRSDSNRLGKHSTSLGEHSITISDAIAQSDSLGEHSITTADALAQNDCFGEPSMKTTDALSQSDSLGEQKTTDALAQSDSLGKHSTSLGEPSMKTTDALAQSNSNRFDEHSISCNRKQAPAFFVFESEDGHGELVAAHALAQLFNGTNVQCVVVAACQSAHLNINGTEASLIKPIAQAGVPHVVGMREPLIDRAATVFVQTLCVALAQRERVDVAVQKSRRAMTQLLAPNEVWRAVAVGRGHSDASVGQWCLPTLFSHDPAQPLVDWDFRPKPSSPEPLGSQMALPKIFIGRRRELRTLGDALRRGKIQRLLIRGAGGLGKTALAGRLAMTLAQQGYRVLAYQAGAEMGFIETLAQVLESPPKFSQYTVGPSIEVNEDQSRLETAVFSASQHIHSPLKAHTAGPLKEHTAGPLKAHTAGPLKEHIAGPSKEHIPGPSQEGAKNEVNASFMQPEFRDVFFEALLAKLAQGRWLLWIEGLERVQNPRTGALTDESLQIALEMLSRWEAADLRILLTSRSDIQKATDFYDYRLKCPNFRDFSRYLQHLGLSYPFPQLLTIYKKLGGNFQAVQLLQSLPPCLDAPGLNKQLAIVRRYLQAYAYGNEK
jgi:hypothetical protein